MDRQLYLPKDWAEERRGRAGVPAAAAFATKPAMARAMIARTLDAGLPCAWVLADAVYGSDHRLRRLLEAHGQPYVLAARSNHTLRFLENWTLIETDPAAMAHELGDGQWTSLTAGEGADDDLGLDHCEARSWHGRHRHMSLVMAAAAYLAKPSADQRRTAFGKGDKRTPHALAAA